MTAAFPADVRASGVLLHPTSLPARIIGDLGPNAYRFVDWLAEAGQLYWQVLPLVPTDSGGSPYNGLSALAGNPLLVSPDLLEREGLLDGRLHAEGTGADQDRISYPQAIAWKNSLLVTAHRIFRTEGTPALRQGFDEFSARNEWWLSDYTLFRALRDFHQEAPWTEWPEEVKDRQPEAIERWRQLLAEEVERHAFYQFLFERQWHSLRSYAKRLGVRIIGDVPIFVAHDSADVWAERDLFELDADGSPSVVSGVPPDYFSATGQRWGNPLYRWDELIRRGYDWWIQRFRRTLEMVDIVRIDHFRGFESYWEIDAAEPTAVHGRWVEGPGEAFFRHVERELGVLPMIAEDLGLITREVDALRDDLGIPGMRVLQFAFDGDPRNPHLPDNYPPNTVAYTGTHDNDTVIGWWSSVGREEKRRVEEWLGTAEPSNWSFIDAVFGSPASTAIVPLQDIFGLGSEARMNTPGEPASNWTWRALEIPGEATANRLRSLAARTGRTRAHPDTGQSHPDPEGRR
jgi:4-alpha-glucanotransferase